MEGSFSLRSPLSSTWSRLSQRSRDAVWLWEALIRFAHTRFKQDVAAVTDYRKKNKEGWTLRCDKHQLTRNEHQNGGEEDRSSDEAAPRRQVLTAAPADPRHPQPPRCSFMPLQRTVSTVWEPNITDTLYILPVNPEDDNGKPRWLLCEGCIEVSLQWLWCRNVPSLADTFCLHPPGGQLKASCTPPSSITTPSYPPGCSM